MSELDGAPPAGGSPAALRQQVLQLWLVSAALDTDTVAWAFYDGTGGTGPAPPAPGPDGRPPYRSGVDALTDGWLLISVPPPCDAGAAPGTPPGALPFCFTFERQVQLHDPPISTGRTPLA
jgi:hypothetical protein